MSGQEQTGQKRQDDLPAGQERQRLAGRFRKTGEQGGSDDGKE